MAGGEAGLRGLNFLIRGEDGMHLSLGGKNTYEARAGDRLRILSPGGGGYGAVGDAGTHTCR